jgi:hypothetical protein
MGVGNIPFLKSRFFQTHTLLSIDSAEAIGSPRMWSAVWAKDIGGHGIFSRFRTKALCTNSAPQNDGLDAGSARR